MKRLKWVFLVSFFLSFEFSFAANQMFTSAFQKTQNKASDSSWARNGATLDMDFVNDRYSLNGTTYSGFSNFVSAISGSFGRTSTATYYDVTGTLQTAASGVARFDYDPVTHEPKGILIEEARTNLFLYSTQLEQASWSKTGTTTVTANNVVAPDGTTTADTVGTNATGSAYLIQAVAFSAGATMTYSGYAKAGTSNVFYIEQYVNSAPSGATKFDLSTLTVTPASSVTASLTNVGNGWYRFVATRTFAGSSSTDGFKALYIDTYGGTTAGKNVALWGLQQEVGQGVSSYIPTTTATVARAADTFSIPPGTWYNGTTGTVIGEAYANKNNTQVVYNRILGADSSTAILSFDSGYNQVGTWNGTTSLKVTGTVIASLTQYARLAHSWDQNSTTQYVAFGSATTASGTYGGTWNVTTLYPGGSNYDPLNACLRRLTFFPVTMSQQALKDFTR